MIACSHVRKIDNPYTRRVSHRMTTTNPEVCFFAVLLYTVIILYIYGMYKMSELNTPLLRGGKGES